MKYLHLLLSFISLIIFCLVTKVFGPIHEKFYIDQLIYDQVSLIENNFWFFFWNTITFLGDAYFIFPASIIVMIILMKRNYIFEGVSYFLLIALSLQFNAALKIYFDRPRPVSLIDASHYSLSFPSGHTLGSVVFYFATSWIILKIYPQLKEYQSKIYFLSLIICLLVGMSRIIIGAHWFSDVVGGILLGVTWLTLSYFLLNRSINYFQFKKHVSL
jgi:undecaprenyl-diphosphatase